MSEQKPLWGFAYSDGGTIAWVLNAHGLPTFSYDKRIVLAHAVARNGRFESLPGHTVCLVGDDGHPVIEKVTIT